MDATPETGKRIGLFDSGVGGLSILRFLQEKSVADNQELRFVYLADTGRCPYGDRSPAEISRYVEQIILWLNGAGVDRIVMACNTSAAVAAPLARKLSKVPVHDLISSASAFAARNYKSIGVIATSATCRAKAFSKAIQELNPGSRVCEIPCPDLVPLVESGQLSGPIVDETIAKYTRQLKEFEVDSLIFGCTHFPFLEAAFGKQLEGVDFIDPAVHLGLEVLGAGNTDAGLTLAEDAFARNTYFCTGDTDKFARAAELCLRLHEGTLKDSVCSLSQGDLINFGSSLLGSGTSTVIFKSPFFTQLSPGS